MLALAAANASLIAPYPYAYSPYAYGAYGAYAPLGYAHAPRISLAQGYAAAPVAVHAAPVAIHAAPLAVHAGHGPVVYSAPVPAAA